MSWTKRIRIHHLHLLISLSETGSLSDTAKQLFTTQPGLSKWLKELEDDVGTPLFERHSRGLQPTETGLLLIAHAHRVVNEMERAEQNLASLQAGSSRTLAIGTSPASAPTFVPAAIMNFLEKYPHSRINIQEGTMNTLLEKLETGKLDLVVGRMDNYQPRSNLLSEILYKESLAIVARMGHPLTEQQQLSWSDLYQYDWIVWPTGTPIRSKLDISLTIAGQKPPPYRIESTSQVGNLWLLQFSDMLAIVSQRVAIHFHERGLLTALDINLEGEQGSVGMCWRDEVALDETMADLLTSFRETGRTM